MHAMMSTEAIADSVEVCGEDPLLRFQKEEEVGIGNPMVPAAEIALPRFISSSTSLKILLLGAVLNRIKDYMVS